MTIKSEFRVELKDHFRGELRTDLATKILYSTDASIYQIEPLGVAFPRGQEDLHAVVELAAKYKVPILPRGAGSSLAGQAIGEALILDCSRWLNDLVDIDPENQTATVEPGLVLSRLNAAAAQFGLKYGPDPASAERATMGGVIGNNATGAHSILYGMSADQLVSADVIQADGSLATWGKIGRRENGPQIASAALEIREKYASAIKQNYPRSWRNSAGYRLNYLLPWSPTQPSQWVGGRYPANFESSDFNLAPLLAGSEGTLAVIRRATVRLVPLPKQTILGVLAYDSVAEACEDVPRLLEFKPSAVELIPQLLIRLARGVPAYARQMGWVQGDPAALLAVEFSGSSLETLKEAVKSLRSDVIIAETQAQQADVWGVRKVGLGIFDSRPGDIRPVAFIEDCAIPVEHLGTFVHEVDKILAAHNSYAGYYAHASAGCLHIRPMLDLKNLKGDLRSISEAVLKLSLGLGGSMSSEHGDGIARGEYLERIYGGQVIEAMRMLKHAADPQNLLNPGKMISAPPMDTNFRYNESYQVRAWQSGLDFSRNNGLPGAIEQCNGQGVCRQDAGVMCPSFQATQDEVNSTRGRANLLRAMISNPGLANVAQKELLEATHETLDLCLACKGCKAECPSGVDMAKLKYEFQHEYFKTHRRKVRDYLFAFIGPLAKLGALLGGFANKLTRLGFVRRLANFLFGLAEKRSLPEFRDLPVARNDIAYSDIEGKERALFFRDTFTHYFEPEVEAAAMEVLWASGVDVVLLPSFGAGRTLLSKGFIESARSHARRILAEVKRFDPEGQLPVLGIEPSELYTIHDEFQDLLPECKEEIEALANRAWLVEEFLLRPGKEGKARILRIANKMGENAHIMQRNVHLHGHCYQKSQPPAADGFPNGQTASVEMLRTAGFEVEIIPSGCCGMAGAFGYEAEHYDLSMQVGELVLFPAVRDAAQEGGSVTAVGTSCRAQIEHGTGTNATHPLVLVAERLRNQGN